MSLYQVVKKLDSGYLLVNLMLEYSLHKRVILITCLIRSCFPSATSARRRSFLAAERSLYKGLYHVQAPVICLTTEAWGPHAAYNGLLVVTRIDWSPLWWTQPYVGSRLPRPLQSRSRHHQQAGSRTPNLQVWWPLHHYFSNRSIHLNAAPYLLANISYEKYQQLFHFFSLSNLQPFILYHTFHLISLGVSPIPLDCHCIEKLPGVPWCWVYRMMITTVHDDLNGFKMFCYSCKHTKLRHNNAPFLGKVGAATPTN